MPRLLTGARHGVLVDAAVFHDHEEMLLRIRDQPEILERINNLGDTIAPGTPPASLPDSYQASHHPPAATWRASDRPDTSCPFLVCYSTTRSLVNSIAWAML
jgi:hypothetical protein